MSKLHLVRHGYTPNNHSGWNGQYLRGTFRDDEYCPLEKEYGIEQAKEVGEYLRNKLQNRKVLFITSPYYRTRETLKYIRDAVGSGDVIIEPSIREIDHGLQYGFSKNDIVDLDNASDDELISIYSNSNQDMDAQYIFAQKKEYGKKTTPDGRNFDSEYIPYLHGESLSDVNRRVRHFTNELKKIIASGFYDDVVVVSHSTALKSIYRQYTGKELTSKTVTGSTITIEEGREDIQFDPRTVVPKDYIIDPESYKDYLKLYQMQRAIDEVKDRPSFSQFFGDRKLSLPIEEDCAFIEKDGETLVILPNNTEKRGYFYIDTTFGQDSITMDKCSESIYYILGGSGTFYLKDNDSDKFISISVNANDGNNMIRVPKKTVFYYESDPNNPLKMIERMTPNFNEENIVVISETPRLHEYKEHKHESKSL